MTDTKPRSTSHLSDASNLPDLSVRYDGPVPVPAPDADVTAEPAHALDADGTALGAFPVLTAPLPRSADPRQVFTGLADLLAQMGIAALVALVENDAEPYEINYCGRRARAAAWSQMTALLDAQASVLCDGKVVGVRFHSAEPQDEADEPAPTTFFLGGLVAYRRRGRRFGAEDAQMIRALVDHAVAVVVAERSRTELAAQRGRVEQLERALGSNREIGVAIGIIMARERCSADEAFDKLRTVSQHRNLKLRDVAAQVAYTGAST